jgi:hypothetical protein
MIWHRERFKRTKLLQLRYLAFDASPQNGVEIFATVERLLTVQPGSFAPSVEERSLPLVTLGHGRASLLEKLQAHVHQVWLDYGSSLRRLKHASLMVRQCLTDRGTEFGIVDAADVTPECIRAPRNTRVGKHLYPNAMQVPGPQHILDTILRDGIERLSWWLVWEASAKAVCQWLHVQSRRDFLKARLQCHASDIANSLDKSCEQFADWRWKHWAM